MIVTLQGGLANQLWQFAFGVSVAKVRKEDVFFTRNRVDADVKRSYALDAFQINPIFVERETENKFYDGGRFNPDVYIAPPDTTFIGYWQAEKFLNPDLVRALTLRYKPSDETLKIAEQILEADNSVFIHVRRGDYVQEKHTANFHGNLSTEYYARALGHLLDLTPCKFFVFSDDPGWCYENFPDFQIVDHNKPGDGTASGREHEDLWLMSLCQHAIIANSAFSFWGALLGDEQKGRTVIAPKQWFANSEAPDMCPERWTKI
jgi:glycosyl transferase family 11